MKLSCKLLALLLAAIPVIHHLSLIGSSASFKDDASIVHLAMVSVRLSVVSHFLVMALHSIISKTERKVMLHLMLDKHTRSSLQLLRRRFESSRVRILAYDVSAHEGQISWLGRNLSVAQYSKYIKLTIADVLPRSLDRVLYLDHDIFLRKDIGLLWDHFSLFNSSAAIGVGPELFKSYQVRMPGWRVIKDGFNTGVMLLKLNKLRSYNFSEQWPRIAQREMNRTGRTNLNHCDQDVMNAVLFTHPDWLFELPCHWNYQVGHSNWLKDHCPDADAAKLVHYSGSQKFLSPALASEHNANLTNDLRQLVRSLSINRTTLDQLSRLGY